MVKVLTKLKITEVSSVDKGAGDGVSIVLMKRRDDAPQGRYGKFFAELDLKKFRTRNVDPMRDDTPAAQDAEAVVSAMRQHKYGKDSIIIGEIIKEYPKKVIMKTNYGKER